VWIPHSRGRSWSCDQCLERPNLRKQRGNCGAGSFRSGLPQSDSDSDGVYVMGYRVAPNCGAFYSELKIRSCPIADMHRMASVVRVYRDHRQGLYNIGTVYAEPSSALIDAISLLHSETEEMAHRDHEQQMKDLKHG